MQKLYVFDPTAEDKLSQVRGVGRYFSVLKDTLGGEAIFVNSLDKVPFDCTFVHPFLSFLQKPLTGKRIAQKQVAVLHDVIPLKYPSHFPAGLRGTINFFSNKFALAHYDRIVTDSQSAASPATS